MRVKDESEKVDLKLNIKKTKIMAFSPITSWKIDGEKWKQWQILFSCAPKSLWMVTAATKWLMLTLWKKSYDKPRQHIKKQRCYFANKDPSTQGYSFSSSYVWMWELDYKESWVQRIDAFELWCWGKLLRVPWTERRFNQLIQKEISSVQSLGCFWLFATPWTIACQASLSITNSQNLLKLMSIEFVMPSNHLNFCHPLLLLLSVFPSIMGFSQESVLCIR